MTFTRPIVTAPTYASAYDGRGLVLKKMRRWPEALASFDRAVALKPSESAFRYNRAPVRLITGDYIGGFEDLEWRRKLSWKDEKRLPFDSRFPDRHWHGENLRGGTQLLHTEQGYGDTIQFVRFAAHLARFDVHVIFSGPQPLARLLRSAPWLDAVVDKAIGTPEHDAILPLMSLPPILGVTLDNLPGPTLRGSSGSRSREIGAVYSLRFVPHSRSRPVRGQLSDPVRSSRLRPPSTNLTADIP